MIVTTNEADVVALKDELSNKIDEVADLSRDLMPVFN